MRRRNPVSTGRQPSLFGGRDTAHLVNWRQATPWELIQVPAARELTNTDLDEMEELVAACREEGSLDALLDEGVSTALATALVQGLYEELRALSGPVALWSFIEDGGDIDDLTRLQNLYADKGFEIDDRWHDGPVYRWTTATFPTFNEDGEHVGEATYLVDSAANGAVHATLATKVMDEVDSGSTDPEDYIDVTWEMETFWDSPALLYHATQPENVESILASGLGMKNESRGLRNRGVSAAVFTTLSEDRATDGMYGEAVFEIDTEGMKAAGLTPRVSQEPDVLEAEAANSLASALGLEDYHHEAENDPETVIVHGHIPARFLRLLEG